FAAVALDSLPWRKLAVVAGIVMVMLNVSVLNQYLSQLARNGAAGVWTDAIFPLAKTLEETGAPVYSIDWGTYDSLVFLGQGRIRQPAYIDALALEPRNKAAADQLAFVLSDPAGLILAHVPAREVYPKSGEHVERAAAALGYRKEVWRTI